MRVSLWLGSLGLVGLAAAADVLSTSGFSECGNGAQDVTVSQFDLSFDRDTKQLTFDVAGLSKVSQNVTGRSFQGIWLMNSSSECNCIGKRCIHENI